MLATLPARSYPESSLANNLILLALQKAAVDTGVVLDATHWSRSGRSLNVPSSSRGLRFHLYPSPNTHTDPNYSTYFTPRHARRVKKGRKILRPYERIVLSSYTKIGERTVNAVCWHGHRDFLRAAFTILPDLRIKSTLGWGGKRVTYRGPADFEAKHPDTATINIGSTYQPLLYADACHCEAK